MTDAAPDIPPVCRVCATPLPPRTGRRGRPPVVHADCRRTDRTRYERGRRRERREGWTVALVRACRDAEAACDAAEGVSRLDNWTVTRAEVETATGGALDESFVPDDYVKAAPHDERLIGDGDLLKVYLGPDVGRSSTHPVGRTLGALDRTATGGRRVALDFTPGAAEAIRALARTIAEHTDAVATISR